MLQRAPGDPVIRSPIGALAAAVWPLLRALAAWTRRVDLTRVLLTVSGLGLLTAGCWTVGLTFGLIATGVALLILEALRDRPDERGRQGR